MPHECGKRIERGVVMYFYQSAFWVAERGVVADSMGIFLKILCRPLIHVLQECMMRNKIKGYFFSPMQCMMYMQSRPKFGGTSDEAVAIQGRLWHGCYRFHF